MMTEKNGNGPRNLFGLPLPAWLPVVVIVAAGGAAWGAQSARLATLETAVEKIAKKVEKIGGDLNYIKGAIERRTEWP